MLELEEMLKVRQIFENCDWFESVAIKPDQIIIYSNRMGEDVFNQIPDKINNKNVKLHFYASKICNPSMYVKTYSYENFTRDYSLFKFVKDNTDIYGRTIMASMFFEVHDGVNSVTNLKIKYPHLYVEMQNYYEEFGYIALSRELAPYGIV